MTRHTFGKPGAGQERWFLRANFSEEGQNQGPSCWTWTGCLATQKRTGRTVARIPGSGQMSTGQSTADTVAGSSTPQGRGYVRQTCEVSFKTYSVLRLSGI